SAASARMAGSWTERSDISALSPPGRRGGAGDPHLADHPWDQRVRRRPLPPRAPGPRVLERRAPPVRAPARPRPWRGGGGAAARPGDRAAGARIRRRRAPLRTGPGQGPHRRWRDAGAGRRPRAEGRGRLWRAAHRRAAKPDPGADLHEPLHPPGGGARPLSRAAPGRRARGTGRGALEAGPAARADPARGLLRGPLDRRAVHRPRLAAAPCGWLTRCARAWWPWPARPAPRSWPRTAANWTCAPRPTTAPSPRPTWPRTAASWRAWPG